MARLNRTNGAVIQVSRERERRVIAVVTTRQYESRTVSGQRRMAGKSLALPDPAP